MTEEISSKTGSPKKKLTDEEKKARQRVHAKAWYLRKKAAGGKGIKAKKGKSKKTPHPDQFIYYSGKEQDNCSDASGETDAEVLNFVMDSFSENPDLQYVYLLKAVKVYTRPTVQTIKL